MIRKSLLLPLSLGTFCLASSFAITAPNSPSPPPKRPLTRTPSTDPLANMDVLSPGGLGDSFATVANAAQQKASTLANTVSKSVTSTTTKLTEKATQSVQQVKKSAAPTIQKGLDYATGTKTPAPTTPPPTTPPPKSPPPRPPALNPSVLQKHTPPPSPPPRSPTITSRPPSR